MPLTPPYPPSRSDIIAEFFALWSAMSINGRPTLQDFDPRSIPEHLCSYWMAKAESYGQPFCFTYYGHKLSHVVGHDRTGELIPTHHQFHKLLQRCHENGRPGWRKGPSESETFNTKDIIIEVIALPLFTRSGDAVDQVMGIAKYFTGTGEPLDEDSYSSHQI